MAISPESTRGLSRDGTNHGPRRLCRAGLGKNRRGSIDSPSWRMTYGSHSTSGRLARHSGSDGIQPRNHEALNSGRSSIRADSPIDAARPEDVWEREPA